MAPATSWPHRRSGAGVGALVGADPPEPIGVGVVANLTMQAMNEWRAVTIPESETRASSGLVVRKTKTEPSESDLEQEQDPGH